MKGLLADVNIQGELAVLKTALVAEGLAEVLAELRLGMFTFPDFGLPRDLEDRPLWEFCQREGLVLLTDNRNHEDANSLQATMNDSLRADSLPVLTPGDKGRFRNSPEYQVRVARSVAEVLYGIDREKLYLGTGRLFLPLPQYG